MIGNHSPALRAGLAHLEAGQKRFTEPLWKIEPKASADRLVTPPSACHSTTHLNTPD